MKGDYLVTGRDKQKAETRKKILETARGLVAHGKNVTFEDITQQAGISRATLYRYYSSIDVLVAESALHIQALPPEALNEQFQDATVKEKLLQIQHYYNDLAFNNEAAYRKYISVAVNQSGSSVKRGARRVEALRLALSENVEMLDKEDAEKLAQVAAVLTGIEALIVTKDVCGLENDAAKAALQWGLEKILEQVLP